MQHARLQNLVGAVFLTFLAVACKKPQTDEASLTSATEGPPLKVQTAVVVEKQMPEQLVLTGTLKASQESQVAADGAGRVTATYVERGQRVKQGETIAILDARGASLQVSALNAQSGLAQAQLEQARKECDRVKALRDSGAISQAEYDRTTSTCQTTQWSVTAAQAQTKSAQKVVGDSVIRAPFAGIIGERYVNVGQYVAPNTTIVSLYAPDPLRLELTVPEANVGGLKVEQVVSFTVSSYENETFQGTVKFIAPNVRPTTRDLIIEALCPNPDIKLKPGMFAIASLVTAEKPLLTLPSNAIQKTADSNKVYVVANKQIQERVVQTGTEKDGVTAVLVGVKAGEQVVIAPNADVRDGAKVQ